MKTIIYLIVVLICTIGPKKGFTQNPSVNNGIATYNSSKNIGKKYEIPAEWDKIIIKRNVTITGSFYMPNRTHPIEICGEDRETSVIQGDGSRPVDDGIKGRSYSAIRCDKSPDLFVHDLKITKPMKFHIHGGFGNVTVERCNIIAGSHTETTDGIHGGIGKTIVKDCYIDVYDDALYTIECKLVENTTIIHNKNGSPFMVSWGAEVPDNHVCVVRNCTVIDNYDDTDYHHGTFGWAQKTDAGYQKMCIRIEDNFTSIVNPGKVISPVYTIGRPGKTGISDAHIEVEGICYEQSSVLIRDQTNSQVTFINCDQNNDDPTNAPGESSVSMKDANCGLNNGEITFTFNDDPGRTGIQFSIDGGTNFCSTIGDNTGSYTFDQLSEGDYECWVRWGNGDNLTKLRTVTLSCTSNSGSSSYIYIDHNSSNQRLSIIEGALSTKSTNNSGDWVQWIEEDADDGYFYIIHKATNGRLSSEDGTSVVTVTNSKSNNSKWKWFSTQDGWFRLENKQHDKWLHVASNGTSNMKLTAKTSTGNNTKWTKSQVQKSASIRLDNAHLFPIEDAIIVYPNPAKNTINILNKDDHTTYQIFTITGQQKLCGTNNVIDISNLRNGPYLIKVNNQLLKFIKQ